MFKNIMIISTFALLSSASIAMADMQNGADSSSPNHSELEKKHEEIKDLKSQLHKKHEEIKDLKSQLHKKHHELKHMKSVVKDGHKKS